MWALSGGAVGWAAARARFVLKDCRHLTLRLEGDLLLAGFAVARLMAAARRGGRQRGKLDPSDALAVGEYLAA